MEKVPLKESFFATSIIGFMVSSLFTFSGRLPLSWGFAFCIVFVMMFIASFVSMTPNAKELDRMR